MSAGNMGNITLSTTTATAYLTTTATSPNGTSIFVNGSGRVVITTHRGSTTSPITGIPFTPGGAVLMSSGQIAGLAAGLIIAAIIIGIAVFFLIRRHAKSGGTKKMKGLPAPLRRLTSRDKSKQDTEVCLTDVNPRYSNPAAMASDNEGFGYQNEFKTGELPNITVTKDPKDPGQKKLYQNIEDLNRPRTPVNMKERKKAPQPPTTVPGDDIYENNPVQLHLQVADKNKSAGPPSPDIYDPVYMVNDPDIQQEVYQNTSDEIYQNTSPSQEVYQNVLVDGASNQPAVYSNVQQHQTEEDYPEYLTMIK